MKTLCPNKKDHERAAAASIGIISPCIRICQFPPPPAISVLSATSGLFVQNGTTSCHSIEDLEPNAKDGRPWLAWVELASGARSFVNCFDSLGSTVSLAHSHTKYSRNGSFTFERYYIQTGWMVLYLSGIIDQDC